MTVLIFKNDYGSGETTIRVVVDNYGSRIVFFEDSRVMIFNSEEFNNFTQEKKFHLVDKKEV